MTSAPRYALLFRTIVRALAAISLVAAGCSRDAPAPADASREDDRPRPVLRIVVMDPLAAPLACECVAGYAQRRYDLLAAFLEKRLGRPVQVVFGENLREVMGRGYSDVHLVIGKQSVVKADAVEANVRVRPVAALTDVDGRTDFRGLFVVRSADPAKTVTGLKGYRIQFGPVESVEKHEAAFRTLGEAGIASPAKPGISPGCSHAAVMVVESDADAAVISSYAFALLEGCDTIDKGALRVVGRTGPVPFIVAFATGQLPEEATAEVTHALVAASEDRALLVAMESLNGFLRLDEDGKPLRDWTDWRGPGRNAASGLVPGTLPKSPRVLWRTELAGMCPAGVAATSRFVVVADKNAEKDVDVWRCLDAATGDERWQLSYAAEGEMDYTNAPRATPVIVDGRAFLLGAFGHLHCVALDSGEVIWKANLAKDFGGRLPAWGYCSTPLVVDGLLILNPGAKDASLAALDCATGKVVWTSPGGPPGYSSFILGTFGGVRQVVGYDAVSLGGWDASTGKRLWTHVPEIDGDFNVATPVDLGGRLLLATENNGTRIHAFDDAGRLVAKPVAHNQDLRPDTTTPVVYRGLVWCVSDKLYCLDGDLKTLWSVEDARFEDYATFIAGSGRVLVSTIPGELVLIEPDRERLVIESTLKVFAKDDEVWSHPALVGSRLYLRSGSSVVCLSLD